MHPPSPRFPTTYWTEVMEAKEHPVSLSSLLEKYYPACLAYSQSTFGMHGHDAVQRFMAKLALRNAPLRSVREGAGRFRGWLKSCIQREHLRILRDLGAEKRGGRAVRVPLDDAALAAHPQSTFEEPGSLMDKLFAETLIGSVFDRLIAEAGDDPVRLAAVRNLLKPDPKPVKKFAEEHGINNAAYYSLLRRDLRRRYQTLLKKEVQTYMPAASDQDIREEMEALRQSFLEP